VATQSPAAVHLLWQALERNADWIADYISISRSHSVLKEYLEWFFERLKDRVPQEATEQDLDQLVRAEVKSIYGEFRDRPSGFPLGDYVDTSAHKFAFGDQARECLEQLPKQIRNLLEDLYSSGAKEITRAELAKKLGIKRNTLDQRISRAMKTIRHRLKRNPTP
jgi:DNA-directed RNA polymerase specialized sigma24 family protein